MIFKVYGMPTTGYLACSRDQQLSNESVEQMREMIHAAMQRADSQRISYIPWDFNYHAKQRSSFILADMASVINTGLDATSFFFIRPADNSTAHQVHC